MLRDIKDRAELVVAGSELFAIIAGLFEYNFKFGLATTSQTKKPILYPCLHTKFYQNSADYGVLFHFAIMAMGLFFCFSRFSRFYVSDLIFWDI